MNFLFACRQPCGLSWRSLNLLRVGEPFKQHGYSLVLLAVLFYPICFSSRLWAEDSPILTPEQAVKIALQDNPDLAQIKARSEAMAAIPSQEGSLPDPTLNMGALNLPTASGINLNKEDMTMLEVGISQAIPFPGKLALRQKAATFEAEAAVNTVEEAQLRLIRDVKMHWWQLIALHRSLLIINETEQLLAEIVEIAQTQYKLGEGLQQDVLTALLEQTKLAKEKALHQSMHRAEIARLNALLGRPSQTILSLPDEIDQQLPSINSVQSLIKPEEATRPLLAERKNAIKAAQTRLELAKKDYLPDFTVNTAYAFRQNTPTGQSRSDFASVQLSMTLPIFADRKQSKAVEQRHSELLKEKYALEDTRRAIDTEITTAFSLYQGNYKQFDLLKDSILPLAQQNVESALTAYQVGKTDFTNVIRAENIWFEYQTQYWQTMAEAQQALAQLIAAIGRESL